MAAILGVSAAYIGGWYDEVVNLIINVFLTIPAIPLLVVISAYLKGRGMWTMAVPALVLWAFEARDPPRPGACPCGTGTSQLAAKASGESTSRIVFGELMPNMISRIAAAFVPPTSRSSSTPASVPRSRGRLAHELGDDPLLGADELDRSAGRVVGRSSSCVALALTVLGLVLILTGVDEVSNPRLRVERLSAGIGASCLFSSAADRG